MRSLIYQLDRWRWHIPFAWWLIWDAIVLALFLAGLVRIGWPFALGLVAWVFCLAVDVVELVVKLEERG